MTDKPVTTEIPSLDAAKGGTSLTGGSPTSQTTPMAPYQVENLKRRETRKNTKVTVTLGFLDEVEELLSVAYYAMCKMGMRNNGANFRYSHEVRMLAWHFSDKDTSKPESRMTDGGGTYQGIREKIRELQP